MNPPTTRFGALLFGLVLALSCRTRPCAAQPVVAPPAAATSPPAAATPTPAPAGPEAASAPEPMPVGSPAAVVAPSEPGPSAPPAAAVPPPEAAPPAASSAPATAPTAVSELAPKSPYSLPFQLRPAVAATAVRLDTSFGAYENTLAQHGFAVVSELSGSWRLPGTQTGPGTGLAPLVKVTVVNDSPPGKATGGFAVVNPLLGVTYAALLGSYIRASVFGGVTLPIGMGGGNTPNAGELDARNVGQVIRAGMDNSLFAVDDIALIPGVDIAYVAEGLTVQAEATFFQLERVRGEKAQAEASKTNLTGGIHVGYFVAPFLSFGAEFRIQWWLNPPFTVQDHKPNTSYDLTSLGVGPRFHFKLGRDIWIRPGVAYTRGFDPPMTPNSFNDNIVQLDIPIVF